LQQTPALARGGTRTPAKFGFTTVRWADVPVDQGTREVIGGGMRVLFERAPVLSRLCDRG
jgi:hypothetical protein